MNDILKEELSDLQIFADPFEEFKSTLNADGWMASLVRKGEEMTVRREANGVIRTLSGPGQPRYRSLRSLLVSESFANLERLAIAQMHLTSGLVDDETGEPKEFLPNAGEIERRDRPPEILDYDRVHDVLIPQDAQDDCLRVFVVDGVAGVGKSYLIRRLVRAKAEAKSYRNGKPLLLHVESRGKVLTSLPDRIAGTLSSLKAGFFEDELKPLVRRGAVQLAIDGFDELSDSRGYENAWGALRNFIRDLQGKGVCILAGRDTMLDPKSVGKGLEKVVGEESLIFLRLRHPSGSEVREWISRRGAWKDQGNKLTLLESWIEESEYLRRPFFISQIAGLGPKRFGDVHGEPIVEIIKSIVRREGSKLLGESSEIDPEMASQLYAEVLSEAARIMMDDETNDIEADLLELLVNVTFEGHADDATVKALAQRADALALMEKVGGDDGKRSFPHEMVRSYFFAQNIFDYFPRHGATTGLHRVPLNAGDFRIFNRVARDKPLEDQRDLRKELMLRLREPAGYDYLRSNLGGLLLSFAPLEDDEDWPYDDPIALSHFELMDVWMADLLGAQRVRLDNCLIHRLDIRGADLRSVEFSNTQVYELLADSYVRFGKSAPKVDMLLLYEHFKERRVVNPVAVEEWISKRRLTSESNDTEPNERLKLLYKFARVSMRQYAIRSGREDPTSRKIVGSRAWPALKRLLEDHQRLEVVDNADAAGPKSDWFHLVAGREFLEPESAKNKDSTRLILRELNADWSTKG